MELDTRVEFPSVTSMGLLLDVGESSSNVSPTLFDVAGSRLVICKLLLPVVNSITLPGVRSAVEDGSACDTSVAVIVDDDAVFTIEDCTLMCD